LVELQSVYERFKELGAELLVISVDDQTDAVAAAVEWGLDYPVLYDDDNSVSIQWNVFNLLSDGVAAPSVFVFDGSGEFIAYKIGEHVADRPAAEEILSVLENGLPAG
jgi:peroxiredoxin